MTAQILKWGSVPVPFTVLWSAEAAMRLAHCEHASRIAVCNDVAAGEGKPVFGKPHMQRQRAAIVMGLCDLCGKPLKGRTKVSLSHARQITGEDGLCVVQTEPLVHKDCAGICLDHCPSLKRDVARGTLIVRQANRYRVHIALLTADATVEFTGERLSGAAGHAKIEFLSWRDRAAIWLQS